MDSQLTKQEIPESVLHFLLGDSENFSFQRQLFNAAALLSAIIGFMGGIASYAADLQMKPLMLSLVFFLAFFALYGIGRWKGYYVWAVWGYFGLNYLFLLLYWLLINETIGFFLPIFFVLACILPILLFGWQLFLAFILNCIAIMMVYLSVVIFPGNVVNQEPSMQYLLQTLFSMVLFGSALSVPALLISRNYRFQQTSIKKLTVRDSLTGLYNQRFLNRIFQREINRARRDNKYLSLLMIDIDNFKAYNEKYGNEMGDEALIRIGRLLMRLTTRGGDYVFRLTGGEFAVIFLGLHHRRPSLFQKKSGLKSSV